MLGYILAFFQTLLGTLLNVFGTFYKFLLSHCQALRIDEVAPAYYMFYPPLAFIRIAYLITLSQADPLFMNLPPLRIGHQFLMSFIWLVGMTIVFMIVAAYFYEISITNVTSYLHEVVPRKHGIRRNPFFFILDIFTYCKRRSSSGKDVEQQPLINGHEVTFSSS